MFPFSVTLLALEPNQRATTASLGTVGMMGGIKKPAFASAAEFFVAFITWLFVLVMPALITRGLYISIRPVAGSNMLASTKTPSLAKSNCCKSNSWLRRSKNKSTGHGSLTLHPVSSNGVERPCAVRGLFGTLRVHCECVAIGRDSKIKGSRSRPQMYMLQPVKDKMECLALRVTDRLKSKRKVCQGLTNCTGSGVNERERKRQRKEVCDNTADLVFILTLGP